MPPACLALLQSEMGLASSQAALPLQAFQGPAPSQKVNA